MPTPPIPTNQSPEIIAMTLEIVAASMDYTDDELSLSGEQAGQLLFALGAYAAMLLMMMGGENDTTTPREVAEVLRSTASRIRETSKQ